MAIRREEADVESTRLCIQMLMTATDLSHLTREEFNEILENETVFDEVANKIFQAHNARNEKANKEHPLMVKMHTNVQKIKHVLTNIDQSSFLHLRDLKMTPA